MRVEILGPVRAVGNDGAMIDVSGARLRALMARLALAGGEMVSGDVLVDGLWGENPPTDGMNALHALTYRLRKALGGAQTVESTGTGFRLRVAPEDVDAYRFEALVRRGNRELAAGSPQDVAALLGEALALWQGPALADVLDAPFAAAAATRLEEVRLAATEDLFEAELGLGHHGEILADLESLAAEHPLRERLAGLRIRALHAAGRRSEALAAFAQVRSTLVVELGLEPSEELQKIQHGVLHGGLETQQHRPQAASGRLPTRLTSFVSREAELKMLAGLMEQARLVTVLGPGGVGKTRLAIEAAGRHRAHRRGRVWFVSLAGVSGEEELADALLGALTSPKGPVAGDGPAGEPLDRAVELLAGGEGLLVLDNCEQITGPVADLAAELLERQPYLSIMTTSREPLQIMGEALCRLNPLGRQDAVRLFLDRAAAVRPGLDLEGDAVADVVLRLDGLPLALELAAARLRSMGIDQIASRLDDRFRLLSTGNRTARPRQQTLEAVIGWSWDLLTEEEKILARRLAVFPAATGAEAVEAICSDAALPADDIVYLLGSLVDKSFLEEGHRMLESIRAYAADKLAAAGEKETIRDRFIRYYADLAEVHEPRLRSAEQSPSVLLFETEYGNLIFALRSAIETADADSAVRLLAPLHWYWNSMRYDGRAGSFVARALELGDALPADARAALVAFQLLADGGDLATDAGYVRALIEECARTGALERYPLLLAGMFMMGFMLGLDDLVEREMQRVRGHSDRWLAACVFMADTFIRHERGDWEGGEIVRMEALRAFEDTGDRMWTAVALIPVAEAHSVSGDHDAAIAAYERSVALAPHYEIGHWFGLAKERMRAGDLKGARRDLDLAERDAEERGQRLGEVLALAGRAELYRRMGEVDRSDQALRRWAGRAREESLLPDSLVNDHITLERMANRLAVGDAARAREMLPAVISAAFGTQDFTRGAELLARLRNLEGDLAGAATALGLSEAIRGAFDHGEPELREIDKETYGEAYRLGAGLSRREAIDLLHQAGSV